MSLYPDYETNSLILIHGRMLGMALLDPDEMAKLQSHIRARSEMVRMGLNRAPTWIVDELLKLDSKLRLWWDSWKEEWVIDRLQEENYYLTVMHWHPSPEFPLDLSLIEALKSRDMQRETPAEQLARKREAAAKIRQQNEKAADEKVLEAIDGLSRKQLSEFIEVEQAIQSGEEIRPMGDDRRMIEAAQKNAETIGGVLVDNNPKCMNPQMDPRRYKRQDRKELR